MKAPRLTFFFSLSKNKDEKIKGDHPRATPLRERPLRTRGNPNMGLRNGEVRDTEPKDRLAYGPSSSSLLGYSSPPAH